MKKLYTAIILLFSLLTYSCFEDKSTEGISELPPVIVDGLETSYSVYTYRDVLKISPTVKDESRYDFCWKVYSTNFNVNERVLPRPDTLSQTRELNYEVFLNPGKYILVFDVKDRQTSVSELIRIDLMVSTLNMTGWYLLKDDGNKTDMDFIFKEGRIDNWIANYNEGRSLNGKAVKAVYSSQQKATPTSSDLFNALCVLSEKDAVICRIDNGKIIWDTDNMFFRKPDVIQFQDVFQPMANNYLCITNNYQVYTLNKGTLFANPPASSYKLSSISGVCAAGILFDKNSRSIIIVDGGNYVALGTNGNDFKNMDADLIWTGGYAGLRNVASLLFRRDSGEGFLVRINGSTMHLLYNSTPLIQASAAVPDTHGLMSADMIAGNYDSDYFYYAKGNQIYITNLATLTESLQLTLPAGETVTCMQHIKYPQPASGVIQTIDYLAIASYAGGKYKVWLHELSSTGEIKPLSQPTFEGNGRVVTITYVEQGNGNRLY
jgi:hypothetical protein